MNFNIKIKGFKNLDFKFFGENLAVFWNRNYKIFLGLFFVFIFLYGGYVWYTSLFKAAWGDEKISEYKASKEKEVSFQENTFEDALEIVDKRKEKYEGNYVNVKDIFEAY